MKIIFVVYLQCIICFGSGFVAQCQIVESNSERFRIMFYNVENLFDTYDDTLKNDEEFLPEGDRFWSYKRYKQKLHNLYKVIIAVGEWEPPDLVGLCEIENRFTLDQLIRKTPLQRFNYQFIHKESPDERGIDVALLYRKDCFQPLTYKAIEINFPDNPDYKTRDILYVKGIAINFDTIHVFINHFPSRWGGQVNSESSRMIVAEILRRQVDSILMINTKSNIVITGDFNDQPEDKSLSSGLNAQTQYETIQAESLYNLSYYLSSEKGQGSYKHEGTWQMLDQFIVSGALLNRANKLYTSIDDVHIFDADFLLETDEKYAGKKPFRTYFGYKFNGGYSDHLPVFIDVKPND